MRSMITKNNTLKFSKEPNRAEIYVLDTTLQALAHLLFHSQVSATNLGVSLLQLVEGILFLKHDITLLY